jgi:glycosyltransferase involved in cell wall biosynthesis
VIVVNDASTDSTGKVASQRGVRVIDVAHRHIAATRNAGAREAGGDILFFVDADTQTNEEAIAAGLSAIIMGGSLGFALVSFTVTCDLCRVCKLIREYLTPPPLPERQFVRFQLK